MLQQHRSVLPFVVLMVSFTALECSLYTVPRFLWMVLIQCSLLYTFLHALFAILSFLVSCWFSMAYFTEDLNVKALACVHWQSCHIAIHWRVTSLLPSFMIITGNSTLKCHQHFHFFAHGSLFQPQALFQKQRPLKLLARPCYSIYLS